MIRTPLALALTALAGITSPLAGQRQSSARFTAAGVVNDLSSGTAVAGALVEFPALRRQALTDRNGRFAVSGMRSGRQNMVISHLGYKTMVREVTITNGELLVVNLEPDPVTLKGVEVQVDRLLSRRKGVSVAVSAFEHSELLRSTAFSAAEFVQSRMLMRPCPSGRGLCVLRRGQVFSPVVYIDERRAFGIDELQAYSTYDIYLVESYDGGRMIRVYTTWFMQNLARNKVSLQHLIIW
jgi:carboxypeptidase-like protein